MAVNRTKALIFILILFAFIYIGLVYFSTSTAEFQITATLTEKFDLDKITNEKSFPFKFNLEIIGIGILPSSADDLYAEVYLEEILVGTLETSRNTIEIPASDTETMFLRFIQDTSTISDSDLRFILKSVEEHNGEIKIDIQGDIKPKVIFLPLKKEITESLYLVDDMKPSITKLEWDKERSGLGYSVNYHAEVQNVYRNSIVEGVLIIDVLYDSYLFSGTGALVDPYEIKVDLKPGEIKTYSGVFEPVMGSRYVLSCEWDSEDLLSEGEDEVQSLFVFEGDISLIDVFWEVRGARVSSAGLSDNIEAHVVLGASVAGVSDYVTVKIMKDLAYSSDVEYVSHTFSYLIFDGETDDLVLPFSDYRSGSTFRWYYIEIVFSDGSSWSMEQLSPPRLKIQ